MYEVVKRISEAAWPLRHIVENIAHTPKRELFSIQDDSSNLGLADRFVKVIELLDGLSAKDIASLLANIQDCWCSYRNHERAAKD